MNIRIIGIDGLGVHEVKRLFSTLTDFDFINVFDIRLHNLWGEVPDICDVTIEIKPDRDDVSIHIFDNSIHIVDCGYGFDKAMVYIDRSAYERLEII